MFRLATRWNILGAVALCAFVGASVLAWGWYAVLPPDAVANASYVGRETCIKCHEPQYNLWKGSDHERAMDYAT